MNSVGACAPTIEHPAWCLPSQCEAAIGGPHLREIETVLDGPYPDEGEIVVTLSQMPGEPVMVGIQRWVPDLDPQTSITFPVAAARGIIEAVAQTMWAAQGSVFAAVAAAPRRRRTAAPPGPSPVADETTGADVYLDPLRWPPVLEIVVGEGPVATLTPHEASCLIRDIGELLASLGGWNSGACLNGRWPHQLPPREPS